MKTPTQIQAEIDIARQRTPFSRHPKTIECWSEYEVMWRTDNGRSYNHVIEHKNYQYHLIYFDDDLAIVEKSGVTIFSHLLPELEKIMEGKTNDALLTSAPQKVPYDRLSPEIQSKVKSKHDNFPIEVQPLLEYELDGNLSLSVAALDILARFVHPNRQK